MKKTIILITPILLIMFMSCSPDECESPETYIDKIVNKDSWKFHHAEFDFRDSYHELTNLEIDEFGKKVIRDYENRAQGRTLSFNNDRTGIYYRADWSHHYDINWNPIENNAINWRILSNIGGVGQFSYFKNTGIEPELSWEYVYRAPYTKNGVHADINFKISMVFR